VSEADAHGTGSGGITLERGRQEVLDAAQSLPPDEEVLIGDTLRPQLACGPRFKLTSR
jgi:hypothetical protein